ncbi:hypothetical protein [Micromonospora lutea]|uniref:Acyl-CoA dehydrogenase/oxidase N-terminal domain-containing protein n=1 Tax=Micromonospora lutea TaxID=419825 RepID=A0ABQ4J2U6_9ACTN|nr:hypothetical protein [Micromonospora lutea]GIJ24495.1 hypothetical protein Vlu01_51190 [Micromonospora lutea]
MTNVPVLSSAQAIALAADFSRDAADRDARRILPLAEVDGLSGSGLLAITVPARHGGADLPVETAVEVFRLLSAGDPNIGQKSRPYPDAHVDRAADDPLMVRAFGGGRTGRARQRGAAGRDGPGRRPHPTLNHGQV